MFLIDVCCSISPSNYYISTAKPSLLENQLSFLVSSTLLGLFQTTYFPATEQNAPPSSHRFSGKALDSYLFISLYYSKWIRELYINIYRHVYTIIHTHILYVYIYIYILTI